MQQHRPRIEDRHKVMVRARLRARDSECEACILDISTRGLSASVARAPARGDIVEIAVGQHNIVGQVKWTAERRFGVAFRERVSVIAAISGKGKLALPGHRQTTRDVACRQSGGSSAVASRKLEFFIFAAAAALAVVVISEYVTTALASLDTARIAMASAKVNG